MAIAPMAPFLPGKMLRLGAVPSFVVGLYVALSVASVLIDRLVGLISLVVLAVVAVLVSGPGRRPGVVAAEAAFGAAAAVALLLLFSSRLRGAVARWLEPRAAGRRLAVGGRFYEALHAYRAHRGVLVAVGVAVGAVPPQEGNLNEPMRVCQGAPPVVGMYSLVNQKVQSSTGSTASIE